MWVNHPLAFMCALTDLVDLWPVPSVNAHVSSVDGRRHLWTSIVHVVGSHGRVATVHGQGAVGGRGGDGVAWCGMFRQVDHGFGTGHVAVEPWLPGVGLPLLPLKQLPHGVVAHGAALVTRWGTQGLVVQWWRHAADAVPLRHAIPGHTAVAIAIMRHIGYPMAWHVSRQRLVWCDAGRKEKTEVVMRDLIHLINTDKFLVN